MERYFRSLKYECLYINEYEGPQALRKGIAAYMTFYHTERLHQSLDYATPNAWHAEAVGWEAAS
jgi:putative transposase